jgi:hypothetical protein
MVSQPAQLQVYVQLLLHGPELLLEGCQNLIQLFPVVPRQALQPTSIAVATVHAIPDHKRVQPLAGCEPCLEKAVLHQLVPLTCG